MRKTTLHYYHPGAFARLEQTLDTMSRAGWQAEKPGRLLQRYVFDDNACYVHRFGVCESREGSADEITYLAENERAGWKVAARKGCWRLFRKPAEEASEGEALPGSNAAIEALFTRRCKAWETFRMWMIVLATLLMLAGYFTDLLPLLYSFALPMLLALPATLEIKYMQEGIKHE